MRKDIFVKIIKEKDSSPPLIDEENELIDDSFLYKSLGTLNRKEKLKEDIDNIKDINFETENILDVPPIISFRKEEVKEIKKEQIKKEKKFNLNKLNMFKPKLNFIGNKKEDNIKNNSSQKVEPTFLQKVNKKISNFFGYLFGVMIVIAFLYLRTTNNDVIKSIYYNLSGRNDSLKISQEKLSQQNEALNDLVKILKEKNEDTTLKYEEYLSSDRELTTVKDSIILLNSEISKTQDEIARIVSENSASVYRVKKENLYSLSGSIQKTMDSTKKIPLGETKSGASIKQSPQKTQYELKKEEVEALIKGVEIKQ